MSRYYSYRIRIYKFLSNGSYDDDNYIELDNSAETFECKEGINKIKDTFRIKLLNSDNKLYETFHSGDGTTTSFDWYWGTLPRNWVDKLEIEIDGVLTTNYSVSGGTIIFGDAPSSGTNNIKIKYPVCEYEDRVEISQVKNGTSFTNDDLVMAGLVNDVSGDSDDRNRYLIIRGVGLIEILFNTLAFSKSYDSSSGNRTNTVPGLIQNVISQVNGLNAGRVINWVGNTINSEGKSFPQITYYVNYKRSLDIIEELSSDRYTKDGQYYYYVNFNKVTGEFDFYWKPKKFTSVSSTLKEGVDAFKLKYDLNDDKVVNAVIYNCGLDPAGHGMEFLHYSSQGNTFNGGGGTKWLYLTETSHIGDDILNNEFNAQSSNWETTSGGARKESFPKDSSYPYTFTFQDRDPDTLFPTGSAATASDDDGFIDAVRLEAKGRGKAYAKRVTDLYNSAKNTFKITMPFSSTNEYVPGEVIKVTSESFGIYDYDLRILEKSTSKGEIILRVEEDESTINA